VIMILILAANVIAVGISREYMEGDKTSTLTDEVKSIRFTLQNGGTNQSKILLVNFNTQPPATLNSNPGNYTAGYTINGGELKEFYLDFKSSREGLYKVDYDVKEITPGPGAIPISIGVKGEFYVQVGNNTNGAWQVFNKDYSLYTIEAANDDETQLQDMKLFSKDGYIEVNFLNTVDFSGFQESNVNVGAKRVRINFTGMNRQARIVMYGVPDNYKILKDGADCSSSQCRVRSFNSGKLTFDVTGFSEYTIGTVASGSGGSSGSGGGSSGGTIPVKPVTTAVAPIKPVTNDNTVKETNGDTGSISTIGEQNNVNMVGQEEKQITEENVSKMPTRQDVSDFMAKNEKNLLIGVLTVGAISLLSATGLLFYVRRRLKK